MANSSFEVAGTELNASIITEDYPVNMAIVAKGNGLFSVDQKAGYIPISVFGQFNTRLVYPTCPYYTTDSTLTGKTVIRIISINDSQLQVTGTITIVYKRI